MITKLFNHPRMITQELNEDSCVIEFPIACSIDANGIVVLEQENRHICIDKASIPDLIKVLREYQKIEVKSDE